MRNLTTLTVFIASWMYIGSAMATPIACQNTAVNHMIADSSQVSSCLASGVGNINGNTNGANPDPFLAGAGSAYSLVSKDDAANPFNIQTTQSGASGTWSIDAAYWLLNTDGALGFKFGTGNQPDGWFVFELIHGMTFGTWDFINFFGTGGGLSHTNLYSTNAPPVPVSEPGAFTLLGLGALALTMARRRRRES